MKESRREKESKEKISGFENALKWRRAGQGEGSTITCLTLLSPPCCQVSDVKFCITTSKQNLILTRQLINLIDRHNVSAEFRFGLYERM